VPWVYNEFGRSSPSGLTAAQIDLYAGSIVKATQQAVGSSAGTGRAILTCPV